MTSSQQVQRAWTAAILLALLGNAGAAPPASHYHDGGTRRNITLETGWVALLTTPYDANQPQTRSTTVPVEPLVMLQRAGQPVARTTAQGQTSPVYREGTSPAGRLMALPGGVVVKLDPTWTESQAHAWATTRRLKITRRLRPDAHWYLIASEPGDAALALANELHASGEVLAATPNWWKQTQPR